MRGEEMIDIQRLLDQVKEKHGLSSDYKMAAFLGITESGIANYRHGRSLPDEQACQKIAAALEIDGDVLVAQVLARRARDADSKALWLRVAERLAGKAQEVGTVTASILLTAGIASAALLGGANPAQAAMKSAADSSERSIHRIRNRRRATWLTGLSPA